MYEGNKKQPCNGIGQGNFPEPRGFVRSLSVSLRQEPSRVSIPGQTTMPSQNTHSRDKLLALAVMAATTILYAAAFPFAYAGGKILSVPESGYVFLVPLALWLSRPRRKRAVIAVSLAAFWIGWTILLFWLRHVTLAGTIALSGILALFPLAWALVARKAMPWLETRVGHERVAILAGLAGLWVVLEWLRSWIFSGFPWLPLAASQWSRPAMLQMLQWSGYLGLSWVLVFFNLAIASYSVSFLRHKGMKVAGFAKPNLEICLAFAFVLSCLCLFLFQRGQKEDEEDLFYAGIVQPYVPGMLKWDPAVAQDNLTRLSRLSDEVSRQGAQVIFWPESSTPWPVIDPEVTTMRQWTGQISSMAALPIVMGNMADIKDPDGSEYFYNGVFVVDPVKGLTDRFYAKRKLVPFGEYNPLAFLTDNFITLPYNFFTPGKSATILSVKIPGGGEYKFGSLVCYEDIFAKLARGEVAGGADFLYVATNNAWYGEEAGAYQHATHSVLRAVENRRPVLRCGNGGWSGLIDEYGAIRHVCQREGHGVYFTGSEVIPVTRSHEWKGVQTFYTRMGDWVVVLALLFTIRLASIIILSPAQEPTPAPAPAQAGSRTFVPGARPRTGRRIGG
jgi:apolipoprotein N-acyltransferase